MHSELTIIILQYFDLFGFFTEYKVILNKPQSKLYTFTLFGTHMVLIVSICIVLYYEFVIRSPITGNVVFGVNDFIKLACATLVYLTVVVESVCKRQLYEEIWTIHKQSDKGLDLIKYLYLKCLLYFILCISAAIQTFHGLGRSTFDQLPFCICFIVLKLVFRTRIFYYAFCLELFFGELKSIGQLANEITVLQSCDTKMDINRLSCAKLEIIRQRYELFCSIIDNLNNIFGLSHFISVIFCFLVILSEFNYQYWCWNNNFSIHWLSMKIHPFFHIYASKKRLNLQFCFRLDCVVL